MTETWKTDVSVSMEAANVYSLLFALPFVAMFSLLFIALWDLAAYAAGLIWLAKNVFLFLAIFFAGIVVHEGIHGLSWALLGRKPLRSIRFGVIWKVLTPYAHINEPLEVNAYRWGALLPGIITGLLPALVGLAAGNGPLLVVGLLFIIAAGGDMLIVWLIRGVPVGRLVEDHPTRAGCYVLEP